MTIRYQIWLKGWLHDEATVEVPDHDDRLSFEDNVEFREKLLVLEEGKIFTLYRKKIAKSDDRVQICWMLPSKVHTMPLEEDNV